MPYFTADVLFSARDLGDPSPDRHMTRNMFSFIIQFQQLISGAMLSKIGIKNLQNWAQLRTSMANISGKEQDFKNRKDM